MKALSDPNRVKIVKALEKKEHCVCELTSLLGLAQPTVSKHLKQLVDAGLVTSSRDGGWVNYRLADGGESPYASALIGHTREWLNEDSAILEMLEKLPGVNRADTGELSAPRGHCVLDP